MKKTDVKDFFAQGGRLASSFSTYECRPQQSEMAESVFKALGTGRHLIVEAGTGVGKSLAYLIPLIEHIRNEEMERAVVSTFTKTLQRQLVEKDLPFVTENLFPDIKYTLCLGSENYLCLRRLNLTRQHGLFYDGEEGGLSDLLRCVNETDRGLYMEVTPPLSLWSKVCRETDLCHGKDCRFYEKCFYYTAKAIERKSQILVSNHHLFFAHVASGWNVLPDFQTVVFDEAHEMERVASDYLSAEVSNTRLKHLLDSLLSQRGKGMLIRLGWLDSARFSELAALVERVRKQGATFFATVHSWLNSEKTKRMRQGGEFIDIISEHLGALEEEIHTLSEGSQDEEEGKDMRALKDRCRLFIESMNLVINQEMNGYVYWAESEGRRTKLVATPIETGKLIRNQVFEVIEPVICTSATLSVQESFTYIQGRLGLEGADTLCLSSPFDFRRSALLYIPKDVPDPGMNNYHERLTREIEKIVSITQGRTLVLFTSYSLIDHVIDRIDLEGIRILRQGDADSFTLIESFKSQDRSVLFGTYTFWQGIDIPGNALQCVVITKLPFSVPTEPVTEARMESISAGGSDPFYTFQVPRAIITFKQGFGRLIRSASDRGIIAVLDSRILKRAYGKLFVESIPEVKIIHELGEGADALRPAEDESQGIRYFLNP
jgi:ATP-dependent DNA helicase DinG